MSEGLSRGFEWCIVICHRLFGGASIYWIWTIALRRTLFRCGLYINSYWTGQMKCPFCRVDNDRVIDSRSSQDGFSIRRRRECLACERRYTTYEHLEAAPLKVVKKGGIREPFQRDKIRRGLEQACWKRPISDHQIEAVVSAIEGELFEMFESEVDSRYVGERVMEQLGKLDQVAYVRFASVYREFTDVRDFVDELRPMLDTEKRKSR